MVLMQITLTEDQLDLIRAAIMDACREVYPGSQLSKAYLKIMDDLRSPVTCGDPHEAAALTEEYHMEKEGR